MRDLRDPQKLGELLQVASQHGMKMSSFYDHIVADPYLTPIPEVSKDDTLGKECVRAYRTELEERAAGGDKYAQSALTAIEKGEKVVYDDPAG